MVLSFWSFLPLEEYTTQFIFHRLIWLQWSVESFYLPHVGIRAAIPVCHHGP